MSHPEQLEFIRTCVAVNRALVEGSHVLEIGAYDVNGSVRSLFDDAARYVGVDLVAGPGVDLVSSGKDVEAPDGSFDVTVSGECFEHDRDWRETLATMVRLTRPGGLVVVTCASRGRVEHGTRRTTATESPGTQALGSDYYRNVSREELEELPLHTWFEQHLVHYAPRAADLYMCGVRSGESGRDTGALPDLSAVMAIAQRMGRTDRLIRLPLHGLKVVLRDERRFQDAATRYWAAVVRAGAVARRLGIRHAASGGAGTVE